MTYSITIEINAYLREMLFWMIIGKHLLRFKYRCVIEVLKLLS